MTPNTKCISPSFSNEEMNKYNKIKTQLSKLGQEIVSKMENLYATDSKIYEKMDMNAEQFKENLKMYKNTNLKIKNELEIQSNNSNMEGMRNYGNSKNLNMDDINGMLSDTDLIVLQENYGYILWSILAVGVLTITINTMKK